MPDLSDLIGAPFKYGGRGPEYDCYGLVMEVYKRLGYQLPDFGFAEDNERIHNLMMRGEDLFKRIEKPEMWALVTFRIIGPYTSHVGIVMPGKMQFLHVMAKTYACIEMLNSPVWRHRITGYFAWPM